VYNTEIHTANFNVNKKTYLYEICYLCYEYYYHIYHWINVDKFKATKWMIPMLKPRLKPIMLNTTYKIKTNKFNYSIFQNLKLVFLMMPTFIIF